MLFENKHRNDLTPKQRLENDFDFLNRSSMPAAQKVRDFYNLWLSRFPEEEALELISRIQSKDEQNCKSATFEIVLYAILITKGYSVSIHPELDNGSKKRPDFLVQTQSGEEFYLEAILASDKDSDEIAAQKRGDQVLKIIDKIDCPNFFLICKSKESQRHLLAENDWQKKYLNG
ncbi:hypothetical protein HR060_03955 [Catenovulum sp. SM1970]|uniref:hypothetical protein n=1 Tax=Marinifaba aquimaris TaxID=2741323 RepID=UPI001572FF43|nr:hypothetical protein [Marinifaba aquimaris]NTS76013.1 hypothetical protein [Marinifaba aquimaris]